MPYPKPYNLEILREKRGRLEKRIREEKKRIQSKSGRGRRGRRGKKRHVSLDIGYNDNRCVCSLSEIKDGGRRPSRGFTAQLH
jgi:hypothetical protein